MSLSQGLKEYLNLSQMEGFKPTTHRGRELFAENVVEQIKKDFEPALWLDIFDLFVSKIEKPMRPYLYENKPKP